jgi:hypothetical protein
MKNEIIFKMDSSLIFRESKLKYKFRILLSSAKETRKGQPKNKMENCPLNHPTAVKILKCLIRPL